jgi:hypothetical protein
MDSLPVRRYKSEVVLRAHITFEYAEIAVESVV